MSRYAVLALYTDGCFKNKPIICTTFDDDDETFLHNVYFTINKYMCNWINYQLNNYHCWLL